MARYGGEASDWIDLSTGINRTPYPIPDLPLSAWTALPTGAELAALTTSAASAFGTGAPILAMAGAQAAIQAIPRLGTPGRARVLSPTYNEHAASLRAAGWTVEEVGDLAALCGADLTVVVNPNNPDGRCQNPEMLLELSERVGRLVVDESFADPVPELSIAAQAGRPGLFVLRSFGKFYGLAGLRLGFVIGHELDIAELARMAGPWPVSGAAVAIGSTALSDRAWAEETTARLLSEAGRLDAMARAAGWSLVGGTPLFRLYETGDAIAARDRLANARIWSRAFPWSEGWLRLGLPGQEAEWERLAEALAPPCAATV
ncbi:Histidinol-phosphate aminotransferase [Defluviimonas aquaemixtae]|uniref:threonine-phosphate decarboxylase n=2 Tax=Albidovulum aquaemixtae TaxID=1542388 RepID=A0A2R8BKD4_9RHOB|nr:Histidinol-phosphate aminotransferase [Defluviimonas aquaemixtae]